jgi:excisionase family DNA binding protein
MSEEESMKLMDVKSVAELLAVSESMVYKLASAGSLACVKVGDCVRFIPDDIEYYIKSNKKDNRAESFQADYQSEEIHSNLFNTQYI